MAIVVLSLVFAASAAGANGEGGDALGDVRRVLLQNAKGFETGDFPLLDSIWAHDEGVTVFESGYANYGWEDYRDHHLKPEVEEMKNVKYELSDIKAAVDGKTAWATFKYSISADYEGKRIDGNGLGTAILQRRADGWKIVHWHTSAPRKKPVEQSN
ncbi:MAG: nuclear transport factor 2 family protein [Thermoanaerobaculia bacterium]|nr:nuclear transport factor 2 family protein [Thermoanaerobaculia bacterium]